MGEKRVVNKVFVKKSIGNKLKNLRVKKSMSVEDFATVTDISPHVIIDIENGNAELYLDEMNTICKEFKINPEYFFESLVPNNISLVDKKLITNSYVETLKNKKALDEEDD
jgi:transcriptional regulator with XRE-family HTH domain